MSVQLDVMKRKPKRGNPSKGQPRPGYGRGPGELWKSSVTGHVKVEDKPVDLSQFPPDLKAYQPFGSAVKMFYCKEPEIVMDGPAGTGKSRGILEKINLICMKYPHARCLVVRKTRSSLTQSAMVTYDDFVKPHEMVTWRATEQEYRYANGSKIIVGGLDKSTRILSTDYDIIFIQEATELTEDEFETLTTRARNGVVPYNQTIADCNPAGSQHWLKRRFEEGKAFRIRSFHEDNPKLYDHVKGEWTDFGRAYLAKLQNLTGTRYKRFFLGEWISAEGVIFATYDPEIHLIYPFEIPASWRRIVVVDFGFKNPFVAQWWALDNDDRMYLYRQIYMTGRTVREHAEQMKAFMAKEQIEAVIADHDASDRATLAENGIATTPAIKTVTVGLGAVQERLKVDATGRPRLFIFRDSLVEADPILVDAGKPTKTEDEFDTYVWQDTQKKDAPLKIDDHGMDDVRYAVMYVDNTSPTGGIYV